MNLWTNQCYRLRVLREIAAADGWFLLRSGASSA